MGQTDGRTETRTGIRSLLYATAMDTASVTIIVDYFLLIKSVTTNNLHQPTV